MYRADSNKNKFYNIYGEELKLKVLCRNNDSVEFFVQSTAYEEHKWKELKKLIFTAFFYIFYLYFSTHHILIDLFVIAVECLFIFRLMTLVQSENICLISNFALQTSTKFFFGRISNFLIPTHSIHDVIINEVILDLRVIYMLSILTKGQISENKPIFPLLDKLRPNLECLEFIYKIIQDKLIIK